MTGPDTEQTGLNAVTQLLACCYRIHVDAIRPGPAGTATTNYLVDTGEARLFVKAYGSPAAPADPTELAAQAAAVELTDFAAQQGIPTPALIRTTTGAPIGRYAGAAVSVWQYLPTEFDVDAGLAPDQLAAIGTVVGRLRRATARWPGLPAQVRTGLDPSVDVAAMPGRLHQLRRLVTGATSLPAVDRAWLLAACAHRAQAWPRVRALVAGMPPITHQVGHGDLASVNILFRRADEPVLIDFRPPRRAPLLYDLSRIALDPRTIVGRTDWVEGLLALLRAYHGTNPSITMTELGCCARFWVAYTACSNYPLADLARAGHAGAAAQPPSLWRYGRARTRALELVLDRLDELDDRLAALAVGR